MRNSDSNRSTLFRYLAVASVLLAGVVSGCGIFDRSAPGLRPRPNVAVFIIDTLRADALGCYGSRVPDTSPELDALAARGVRFAHAYAQCSWTRPSVGAMLTGLYPRRLGIYYKDRGILGDDPLTLAEVLRDHGYATFGATANPHMNTTFNFHQGFDIYIDSSAVYGFMGPGSSQTIYKKSTLATAAAMFAQVLEFDQRRSEGPKYVQLNLMEVHEWYRGRQSLTRPEYDSRYRGFRYGGYHRAVRQISTDLGGFVEELRSRPGWDDALFVFVSDHGEGLNSHPNVAGTRRHGRVLYESQLHVPFVIYREGWEFAGRVVERPVRVMDLMPTVLDAAGIPAPRALDGVSLMPLVRDPGAQLSLPEYLVAELGLRDKNKAAVYGKGWRYYENADGHKGTAPRELQVAGSPENGRRSSVLEANRAQADEMAAFLDAWVERLPPAPSKRFKQAMSSAETEQLRALGYIQ